MHDFDFNAVFDGNDRPFEDHQVPRMQDDREDVGGGEIRT